MTDQTLVRPMTPEDHQAWLPMWRGYQRFYNTTISEETSAETFRRLTGADPTMAAALAVRRGRAIGFVHVIRHRSCWTTGDYCYLQDLYVDEAARGSGAGRALISHVYKAAEAAGCARVYWLTHETNTQAMALYDQVAERSGFIQYRKIIGP